MNRNIIISELSRYINDLDAQPYMKTLQQLLISARKSLIDAQNEISDKQYSDHENEMKRLAQEEIKRQLDKRNKK